MRNRLKIQIVKEDCVIIETNQGNFYIESIDDETQISMYDHFEMVIIGRTKQYPKVIIDSEEFETRLEIKETEKEWMKPHDTRPLLESLKTWPAEFAKANSPDVIEIKNDGLIVKFKCPFCKGKWCRQVSEVDKPTKFKVCSRCEDGGYIYGKIGHHQLEAWVQDYLIPKLSDIFEHAD